MKLNRTMLFCILMLSAILVVAGCSKPLAGQAINFGGVESSTEGCPQTEWWYELSDGTLLGEGRGGIVGCTTYNSQGQEGTEEPWCGITMTEKDGKQVYVSGGEWKRCEKVSSSDGSEETSENSAQESRATGQAASQKESSKEKRAEQGRGFGGSEPVPCSDSDDGLNYNIKGTLTNPDGETYEDFCSWGDVGSAGAGVKKDSSEYVYEYYCSDDKKSVATSIQKCGGGCKEGACVKKEKVTGFDAYGQFDKKATLKAIKVNGGEAADLFKLSLESYTSPEGVITGSVGFALFADGKDGIIPVLTIHDLKKVPPNFDLGLVTVTTEDSKVVVTGLKGVKHQLVIPNTKNNGVKVCPEAVVLADMNDNCPEKVVFTHGECVLNTKKGEVQCGVKPTGGGIDFKGYYITVPGSGADENDVPVLKKCPFNGQRTVLDSWCNNAVPTNKTECLVDGVTTVLTEIQEKECSEVNTPWGPVCGIFDYTYSKSGKLARCMKS